MNSIGKQQPRHVSRREQKVINRLRFLLRRQLLAMGGNDVMWKDDDPYLGMVAMNGKRCCQPVHIFSELTDDDPHWNAALYWAKYREVASLATGYALDDDGAWKSHSWVLKGDEIIETIAPKQGYFGIVLNYDQTIWFWTHQC